MKTYQKTSLHALWLAALAGAPTVLATPVGVSDDFESATPGNLDTAIWSETFNPGPVGSEDTTQQFLYQVVAGGGSAGSQGVAIDGAIAKIGYNATNKTAPGVTGDVFVLESKFQMEIGENVPAAPNQGIVSLVANATDNWFSGPSFGITLIRRNSGKNYGIVGLGFGSPQGWEQNSEIGLPNTLPGAGLTATSDWLTIRMTLSDAGAGTWNAKAEIINGSGAVVYEIENLGITITGIAPGDTLYGRVAVPYVAVSGVPQTNPISEGGVTALNFDDFSFFGYSSSIDADMDGLTEAEEGALGTSDLLADTDEDCYNDKFEVDNGFDPLDPDSNPELTFFADYTAAKGYSDGNLAGQKGWIGQSLAQVDSTAGTATSVGGPYDRNAYATGLLGGTGGDPNTAVGFFSAGDVIKIVKDFEFTLPSTGNATLLNCGFREEALTDQSPTHGFTVKFNGFSDTSGGSVRFYPDLLDQDANEDGLFIDGKLLGLNRVGDPSVGDGSVDLDSDPIRMTYVATCTDEFAGTWEVTSFEVTNLNTTASYSFSGPTRMFDFFGIDAFYGHQLAPNGLKTPINQEGRSLAVKYQYGSILVDNDMDGLPQTEELALGTSDGKVDTDGDTFSDFAEVNAVPATDPLDIASYTDAPIRSKEDFNALALGTPPISLWNTKYDGSNPSQQLRWAVEAGTGTDASQGYGLDVSKAWLNYHTINQADVTGEVITYSADFNLTTTGAPLNEEPAPGVNGVNDSLFGLRIDTTNFWYSGTGFNFTLCRLADDSFGFKLNSTLEGSYDNSEIGLSPGLTASTSDWFTMTIQMTETSPGSGAYQAVCSASHDGTTFYTSAPVLLDAAFVPGSPVYGGMTTGFNNDPSNGTLGLVDPGDTAINTPIGQIGKISSVNSDNFCLVGYSTSVDIDGDNLTQAQEFMLGTDDLKKDTDGDTFDDDVEVTAGTDPLDPLDFPGSGVTIAPEIVSFTFTGGNTVDIVFTGEASTVYQLMQSDDLVTPFVSVATTPATDVSGNGSVNYVMPAPGPKAFFRIQE